MIKLVLCVLQHEQTLFNVWWVYNQKKVQKCSTCIMLCMLWNMQYAYVWLQMSLHICSLIKKVHIMLICIQYAYLYTLCFSVYIMLICKHYAYLYTLCLSVRNSCFESSADSVAIRSDLAYMTCDKFHP